MSRLLKSASSATSVYGFADGYAPIALAYSEAQPAIVQFGNGDRAEAACLSCPTSPCVSFSEYEIASTSLPEFPADTSTATCAADAIWIDPGSGSPEVDPSKCIGCGVCASRCPVGAIYLRPDKGARVAWQQDDPAYVKLPPGEIARFNRTVEALFHTPKQGVLAEESDALLALSERAMELAMHMIGDRFPVLHTRNLLIAAGQGAAMRRRGNNHMRMDLVLGRPGAAKGLVEVEFGQLSAIESPRDVLDSAAVLHSRYGWALEEMTLLIVKDALPNVRSGYWDVLADIAKVLNMRIGTLTTLALHLAIWLRRPLPPASQLYVDRNNRAYRKSVLEVIAGRPLRLSAERRSSIEPAK